MSIIRRLRSKARGWIEAHANGSRMHFEHEILREVRVTNDLLRMVIAEGRRSANPVSANGLKVFSQADEDGVTMELCRRIGISGGTAIEIGSGDGAENNSLVLLAQGWRCIWVDVVRAPEWIEEFPDKIKFLSTHVNAENVNTVLSVVERNWLDDVRFISVDIDGMEGYVLLELLSNGLSPDIVVAETNRIMPPPIRFKQPYDSSYQWDHSINSGWSLQTFIDELGPFGYRLVACNEFTGVNAFFVHESHISKFADVPNDPREIFVGRGVRHLKYSHHGLVADIDTAPVILRAMKKSAKS